MAKLVECAPNFSEGRNKEVIDAIADAMSATEGCSLLDVDPGSSTNRTVYTFVGPPAAVIEGALNAARVAFKLIDMTKHSGTVNTLGRVRWMCVPSYRCRTSACVQCANEFGQRLSDMLNVPGAARKESRRSLPSIRAGNTKHYRKSEWTPEYGPATFFLIAYNMNLLSTKEQAHRITLDIREQGRGKDQPGLLRKVQGIGWYLEEANLAQVSTNILDFEVTPVHMVYEEICKDARDLNLPVAGSQIVGLIPLKAMLDCADFYIQKEKLFIVEEEHKIRLVISKLGLGLYLIAAPGGGSVSAAITAMGAALGCMVGQMTYGKRQFESLDAEMRKLIPPFHEAMNDSLLKVDADSMAFNSYMPKGTPDEIKRKEGLKVALGVPLSLAERINKLWPALKEMVKYGNVACKSDIQVAAKALETAVFGAYYNVIINLKDITDASFRATEAKVSVLLKNARQNANIVLEMADQRK
uniref:Formimidoyltransferase-cyclodeaminase n=1 Tax=Sinocyclocheilus rhinocerous TaxID=307959 RepID=A0A673LQ81_9TELE